MIYFRTRLFSIDCRPGWIFMTLRSSQQIVVKQKYQFRCLVLWTLTINYAVTNQPTIDNGRGSYAQHCKNTGSGSFVRGCKSWSPPPTSLASYTPIPIPILLQLAKLASQASPSVLLLLVSPTASMAIFLEPPSPTGAVNSQWMYVWRADRT